MPLEIFAFLLQAWRKFGHGVVEEAIRGHGRHSFGYPYGFVDFLFQVCDCLLYLILCEQVAFDQKALVTRDGVSGAPDFYFRGVAIARWIIGGGVRSDAVGERFYQRWPFSRAGTIDGLLHDIVDGEDIVAIHQHGRDTKTGATGGKDLHGALLVTGNADGPAVILHHQDDRCMKDTREIQGFVEIAY